MIALRKGAPLRLVCGRFVFDRPFQYFLRCARCFSQFSAVSLRICRLRQTGLPTAFFCTPKALETPQSRRNAGKPRFGRVAERIPIGNFPASRPSGSALDTGAAPPGSTARRKRRVEPDGVRPSSPRGAEGGAEGGALGGGALDGGSDGRSAAAGRKAGRFPPVSSFASFGGVGRPRRPYSRRTSGVDRADIGRRNRRVKEINCNKGIFWGTPGRPAAGRVQSGAFALLQGNP